MGPAPSPATVKIMEMLLEGDRERSVFVKQAAKLVPPGQALRHWERVADRLGYRYRDISDDRKIKYGAARIIHGWLHSKQQHGMIESYRIDGVTYVGITENGRIKYGNEDGEE